MSSAGDIANISASEQELIEIIEGRSQKFGRIEALKALSRRRSPARTRGLIFALKDRNAPSQLRATAALVLGTEAKPEHQEALVASLVDEDPVIVRRSAEALGRIGDRASLDRLEAVKRPDSPVAEQALAFGRTLISYRLSLGRHRLTAPTASSVLKPGRPVELKIERASETAIVRLREHVRSEAPGVPLSLEAPLVLNCAGDELAVLLHEEIARAGSAAALTERDAVAAVVLKHYSNGVWALYEYVFAHPAKGGAALFGVRPSGTVTHFGTARMTREAAEFTIAAINTVHSPPLEIDGQFAASTLELTRAVADRRLAPTQERPRVPQPSRGAIPRPQ